MPEVEIDDNLAGVTVPVIDILGSDVVGTTQVVIDGDVVSVADGSPGGPYLQLHDHRPHRRHG